MKVIHPGQGLERNTGEIFDGEVAMEPLVTEHEAEVTRITLVRFTQGARTRWHTHTFDQVLMGTEGVGTVADEQEAHTLQQGELIVVPKGTVHWHGAKPGTDFAHLNIAIPGDTSVVRGHDGSR